MKMSKSKPKKMAVGGVIGALMNKDKPGGMLAGLLPGAAGMLAQRTAQARSDAEKKAKDEAAAQGRAQKMAKGGMCRGMGAASKGGKYKA
jgi:hypothetical protein